MPGGFWITSSWADNVQRAVGEYTEDHIDALMAAISRAGGDVVLWRVDGAGRGYYHSEVLCPADGSGESVERAEPIRQGMKDYDPLAVAVECAHRNRLKLFAWTCLFDSKTVRPRKGRDLADPFLEKHPEWYLLSRDGKTRMDGVLCYAYPEVVEYRLRQYRELLARYHVDGLHLSTRSHAQSNPNVIDRRDWYGYNEPWIDEFKQRYDGLDPRDGLPTQYHVEKWTELRGECLTGLLQKTRGLAEEGRAELSIDVYWKEDHLLGTKESGEPRVLARRDWPLWIREGVVDYLVLTRGRRAISDISFLDAYRPHFAGANAKLVVWHNLLVREYDDGLRTVTRPVTPDEIRLMKKAIRSGAVIDCFHESADIEFCSAPERYWRALSECV